MMQKREKSFVSNERVVLVPIRTPLLQALIGLFELPEDDSIPDDEHFIDIEDTPGYQTAFSQLAFAGKKEHDPIGDAVGNPKILLAQSLHKLSTACPGRVSHRKRGCWVHFGWFMWRDVLQGFYKHRLSFSSSFLLQPLEGAASEVFATDSSSRRRSEVQKQTWNKI